MAKHRIKQVALRRLTGGSHSPGVGFGFMRAGCGRDPESRQGSFWASASETVRELLRLLVATVVLSGGLHAEQAGTVLGDLRVESFHSSLFGDTQTLRVWLPPGYHDPANATRHYPVLYLLDGQNLFDSKTAMFGVEWQVDETLTRLISEGKVEPIIVVGIDSPSGTRREAEYLPYPDYLNEPQTVVEGARFPDFMVTEVLPRIEKEYRASTEARGRGIGGASYGAIAALYTLIHRPQVFQIGLLESPSLHVANGALLRETEHLTFGPRRVVVGVGSDEVGNLKEAMQKKGLDPSVVDTGLAAMAQDLAAELKGATFNHPEVLFVEQPGAQHNEKAWQARFPRAISYLYPASTP